MGPVGDLVFGWGHVEPDDRAEFGAEIRVQGRGEVLHVAAGI